MSLNVLQWQHFTNSLSSIDASFEKLLELAANLHLVDEKLSLTGNSGASESIVSPRKLIGLIEYNCHGYEEFKRSHVNGDGNYSQDALSFTRSNFNLSSFR